MQQQQHNFTLYKRKKKKLTIKYICKFYFSYKKKAETKSN